VRGLVHPEMGHIRVQRHPRDSYAGCCPFHGDCLEGLASGPAIRGRWSQKLSELGVDHEAWEIESYYIAQLLHTITSVVSPHRIVLGGGVGGHAVILDTVRAALKRLLAEYPRVDRLIGHLDEYVVAPKLGGRSGVLGALCLAQTAAAEANARAYSSPRTPPRAL
jgi:fructokinase